MLTLVKLALRITTDKFDDELNSLIAAAVKDMGLIGIDISAETDDALLIRAITTFVKLNFGEPDNYDKLQASYNEQKAQLQMSESYRVSEE